MDLKSQNASHRKAFLNFWRMRIMNYLTKGSLYVEYLLIDRAQTEMCSLVLDFLRQTENQASGSRDEKENYELGSPEIQMHGGASVNYHA
jgi:hypothetical protein